MTNEEKAIELFTSEVGDLNVPDFNREFEIKTAIVAMAEWKDQEFAKQKDTEKCGAFFSRSRSVTLSRSSGETLAAGGKKNKR